MSERLCGRLRRAALFILATSAVACSLAVNRTIDDEKGDSVTGAVPSYSPVGAWSQGATCDGCFIHLDTSQAFDGTWHDSTHTPGDPEPRVITAKFTGTAVYVYNVLANTVPFTTTFTSITFTLDGKNAGQFTHVPTDSTDFQYNVAVFAQSGLSNTDHTIVIEANGATNSSLVLFDYIVYTFEDDVQPTSNPPTSPPTTAPNSPPTTSPNSPGTIATDTRTVTITPNSPTSPPPTSSPSANTVISPTALHDGTTAASLSSSINSLGSAAPAASLGLASSSPSGSDAQSSQTGAPGTPNLAASSQDKSSISAGAVAGGVVGGVVVVVAASLFALCFIRRRRRAASPDVSGPDMAQAPTRTVEPGAALPARNGPTTFGATAQNGSTSAFMESPPPARADVAAMRLPHPHWVSSSELGSSSDGSSYTASGPPTSHGGSTTALFTSGYSPSSGSRAVRPLPQPSTSDSGSSSRGVASPSPNVSAAGGTLHPSSTYHGAAIPPSLPLTQSFPRDVKAPLANSGAEDPFASRPPSPTRTVLSSAASTTGTTTLRAQVALLQEEVERLREQQEMQRLFEEAPPQYHEA